MLKKLAAFELLVETIRKNKKHQDYDHVVELSKTYKAMMTGKGLEDKMQQFNLREDDVLFDQRKRLTTLITSCITGALMTPEKKVPSVKPITKSYDYTKTNSERKAELNKAVENFYGGQGVDNFQNDLFMNLWDSDPNAFILYLFNDFNSKIEKPTVYGTEISSEDAVDYEFVNNILEYLTVKKTIRYEVTGTKVKDKATTRDGSLYSLFAAIDQIEFTQVDVDSVRGVVPDESLFSVDDDSNFTAVIDPEAAKPKLTYYYRISKTKLFKVIFYELKAKQVPAFRVGLIPDTETDRRTCVNGWHRALPYLIRSIKPVSELDISVSLHAFPQKFEYRPRCLGVVKEKKTFACDRGMLPDNSICTACNGSGFQSHSSAQDVITLAMPRNKEEAFDLTKLAFYLNLPIDIIKWLDEYIDKIELKAQRAVYNSDVFIKTRLADTATKEVIDMQSVYDALNPLFQRYSYAYVFTVRQTAIYLGIDEGLVVKHIFPKTSKFESINSLIERLKTSRDAGVNDYVLAYMDSEITDLTFVDQPEILQQIQVKQRFFPFVGKTQDTIMSLISSNKVLRFDEVLYIHFSRVFSEIESEFSVKQTDNANPNSTEVTNFYALNFEAQKKLVVTKVDQIISKLDAEKPPLVDNTSPFFSGAGGN